MPSTAYGLVFEKHSGPIEKGEEVKIVWRMTGTVGLSEHDHPAWVLLLSTSCENCRSIVSNPNELAEILRAFAVRLLVAGPDRRRIETFIRANRLANLPFHSDPDGDWTKSALGTDHYPVLLLIESGIAMNAFEFFPSLLPEHF